VEEAWSLNHAKLLYLVSKYAVCARRAEDQEGWIRSLPLIILMYEGIVAGVLDFDYAPASTLISMVSKSAVVMVVTAPFVSSFAQEWRANYLLLLLLPLLLPLLLLF